MVSNCMSMILVDPVGIDELNHSVFTVYPNPTNGNITIQGDIQVNTITVYGLDGTKLITNSNVNIANLESLSPGRYIISIETNEGVYQSSVVKY